MPSTNLTPAERKEFLVFGRALWEAGLIHLTSGNLSVRKGSAIYITRTGSRLGFLSARDVVRVDLEGAARDRGASSETPVHRALYKAFPEARAVAHAHPPCATALSFGSDAIEPQDSDRLYIPRIPVLTDCEHGEGSACVAAKLPALMRGHDAALVRGHGVFAAGPTLGRAADRISMLENQCRLIFLRRILSLTEER